MDQEEPMPLGHLTGAEGIRVGLSLGAGVRLGAGHQQADGSRSCDEERPQPRTQPGPGHASQMLPVCPAGDETAR
jgi:hypothetical protein